MLTRVPTPYETYISPAGYQNVVENRAARAFPQAYKDVSSDSRTGLSSFFAYGKRSAERDAFQQAHMTPGGTPGVLNLAVVDHAGTPIPFAPFNWNGRQMLTDQRGMIKYVEKDYFQTAISLENERVKYVTQMISLVAGQPSDNVIALFGWEFYAALAGCDRTTDEQARHAIALYRSYLQTAGLDPKIVDRKVKLFERYSNAECSPEVMCNFGDNDPEWSRAFNKLSLLIEYHPSAILFDSGHLNPLESSGRVHGDKGTHNAGDMDADTKGRVDTYGRAPPDLRFPDSNRTRGAVAPAGAAAAPPPAGP